MQLLNELCFTSFIKQKSRLAIVAADDKHVLEAVKSAILSNIITPIFIGNADKIAQIATEIDFDISSYEIINIIDPSEAAYYGISLIKSSKADILMKGFLTTKILMRAVLDKTNGLIHNAILSHVSINQISSYSKLIVVTDAAVNIKPSLNDKVEIIKNAVAICEKIGIHNPKVAVICRVEFVNPKIESTVHASLLMNMNKQGIIKNCIVEGPLALDNAISIESAILKGIEGLVVGNADILLTPDLDSGNILYKALNFMANGSSAAVIAGAQVPIVLTSRSDSAQNKLNSIALACSIAQS